MIDIPKKILLLFIILIITGTATSQSNGTSVETHKIEFNIIKQKLFFSLFLLEKNKDVRKVLNEDAYLTELRKNRINKIREGAETCGEDINCHASNFYWTEDEIESASERLGQLVDKNIISLQGVIDTMRSSGKYANYQSFKDSKLLTESFRDAAKGMNLIVDTYALGKSPRYAKIDSIRYDKNTSFFKRLIDINVNSIAENLNDNSVFFEASLRFSLNLLVDNEYLKAANFEPLEKGENERVIEYAKTINWENFEYSLILVPGYGPTIPGQELSPIAKYRLALAVKRFRDKKAPLILVSGGSVSPFGTQFNEAFEMKKELVNKHGIPESAIIMEPHARHTTTNIRNSVRLIFTYGIPNEKKVLLTSTKYQHDYILRQRFNDRCMNELGFLPYSNLKSTSNNDIEFLPIEQSLHINSSEPLDP